MEDITQPNERPNRACKRRIDRDAVSSSRKRPMRQPGLDDPPRITQKHLSTLINYLSENREPYAQNDWRMQPWDRKPYEILSAYKIADDVEMAIEASRIVKEDLFTDLEGSTEITPELLNMPTTTKVRIAKMPCALEPGKDIEEHCSWGIDCFTKRGLMDALSLCSEWMSMANSDDPEGNAIRSSFVEKELLPALNSLGNDGWDLFKAARKVAEDAHCTGDYVKFATASRLLQLMQRTEQHYLRSKDISVRVNKLPPHQRVYFRGHPKGQGVFCCLPGGIPAGTFVGEYFGELYSPWRWFERQDVFKKRNPDSCLPDFYNIQLERPTEDENGYGLLFVEGANKGNFVSRLCHSCRPNCRMMSVCAENRLTNALFTLRHISEGEELSWDYSCVTESEKEYRSATCLCGSDDCRGSFLYYANSSSFQQIVAEAHNFLDRNAIILRAASEELTDSDIDLLRKHGIKRHALRAICDGDELIPAWLIKWAALVLEFMLHEKEVLPGVLIEKARLMPELQLKYSEENHLAAIEAQGVFMNRLQNLTITLDKAKYFLGNQKSGVQHAPLRFLSEDEILNHLWLGRGSVVQEARDAIHKYYLAIKSRDKGKSTAWSVLEEIDAVIDCLKPSSAFEARGGLRSIATILKSAGPEHASLHDGLILRANTEFFFTPNKYVCITSSPVQIPEADAKMTQPMSPLTEANTQGAGEISLLIPSGKSQSREPAGQRADKPVQAKKYSSAFLWGQLLTWYKQTIYNPAATLSAERRGTLCLPVLENCYNDEVLDGTYISKVRPHMIDTIEKKPDALWPSRNIWSYRNTTRVFGSPMMDQALLKSRGQPNPELMQNLVETMRQAYSGSANTKGTGDSLPATDRGGHG